MRPNRRVTFSVSFEHDSSEPARLAPTTISLPTPALALVPVGDWQFWVVTTITVCAMVFLARPLLRKARGRDKEKPATLTIGGKALGAKPSGPQRPAAAPLPLAPPRQDK